MSIQGRYMYNSFFMKITLPTRFSNKYVTLIDTIFCKLTKSVMIKTAASDNN